MHFGNEDGRGCLRELGWFIAKVFLLGLGLGITLTVLVGTLILFIGW